MLDKIKLKEIIIIKKKRKNKNPADHETTQISLHEMKFLNIWYHPCGKEWCMETYMRRNEKGR